MSRIAEILAGAMTAQEKHALQEIAAASRVPWSQNCEKLSNLRLIERSSGDATVFLTPLGAQVMTRLDR